MIVPHTHSFKTETMLKFSSETHAYIIFLDELCYNYVSTVTWTVIGSSPMTEIDLIYFY